MERKQTCLERTALLLLIRSRISPPPLLVDVAPWSFPSLKLDAGISAHLPMKGPLATNMPVAEHHLFPSLPGGIPIFLPNDQQQCPPHHGTKATFSTLRCVRQIFPTMMMRFLPQVRILENLLEQDSYCIPGHIYVPIR